MTKHATYPECPECGARDKVVVDTEHHKWHCFECGKGGTVEVQFTTDGK